MLRTLSPSRGHTWIVNPEPKTRIHTRCCYHRAELRLSRLLHDIQTHAGMESHTARSGQCQADSQMIDKVSGRDTLRHSGIVQNIMRHGAMARQTVSGRQSD